MHCSLDEYLDMPEIFSCPIQTDYFNNYLKDPDRPVPLDGSALISSGMEGGDYQRGKAEGMGHPHRGPGGGGWGGHEMMMQGTGQVLTNG